MARSQSVTSLSIDEWGMVLGIEPYTLNQVGAGFPLNSFNTQEAQCDTVFFQESWHQNFLGREEIGSAIEMAESAIALQLKYWPAPRYFVSEEVQFPRPAERYLYGAGTTKRFQSKGIQLQWGKIQGAGTIIATDLGAQVVNYTSSNSVNGALTPPILDTFTISFATTITDPTQLAVYFTPSDRDNAPFDDTWRLRPVQVTISGGTATIKGHRSLCVKPELQMAYTAQILDVTVAGNFVTNLQAYSLVLDTSTTTSDPAQGQAEWEGYMNSAGVLVDCTNPPCQVEVWPVCIGDRNWDTGMVYVDYLLQGQNNPSQYREPDRVVCNYVAGVPRQTNGRMDRTMANIVARLATAFLSVEKCGCERSDYIIRRWRSYPGDGFSTARTVTNEEVSTCPWEPTNGGLYAWHQIRELRVVQAAVTS